MSNGPPVIAQAVSTTTHVVRGPEPIGAAQESALAGMYGLGMAGANGEVRIGLETYHVRRFMGWLGALQNFGSGPFVGGNGKNVILSLNASQLPSAAASTSTVNPVLAAIVGNEGGAS